MSTVMYFSFTYSVCATCCTSSLAKSVVQGEFERRSNSLLHRSVRRFKVGYPHFLYWNLSNPYLWSSTNLVSLLLATSASGSISSTNDRTSENRHLPVQQVLSWLHCLLRRHNEIVENTLDYVLSTPWRFTTGNAADLFSCVMREQFFHNANTLAKLMFSFS